MELIRELCNWLCFLRLKSLNGCIIGAFFLSPIGVFWGVVIGLVLGGGWSASFVKFLTSQEGGMIGGITIIIGSIIGFFIIFFLFLVIGANVGNLLGYILLKLRGS
ncbi:MAG: hypothetical protein AB1414_21395 [bacterium]